MKINSYRLVPGKVAYWGDIVGNISEQKDLVEYISSHGGGDAVWGSITGNISEQSDLMNLVSSFATESWVESQGYLTSVPSEYATQSWVESQGYLSSVPSEYATQSWVESQGYLTSVPEGYATESWVSSNFLSTTALSGYATESWVESGYVSYSYLEDKYYTKNETESWVQSQGYLTSIPEGYATESWVLSQGYITSGYSEVAPLFSLSEGYLKYSTRQTSAIQQFNYNGTQFFDQYGQCYVWTIDGGVYGINFLTPEYDEQNNPHIYIYLYNPQTNAFEHVLNNGEWVEVWGTNVSIPLISAVTEAHFLWVDNSGRVYYSNKYQVNLQTGEFTEVNPGGDMGGTVQTYNGSKNNIVKINGSIYMLYGASTITQARAYVFDETNQRFVAYGSGTSFNGYGIINWYKYGFYYEGTYYYTRESGGNLYVYTFTVGTTKITASTVATQARPFPFTFTYDGQSFKVTGDRIRKVELDGENVYIYYYGQNAFQLKYDDDLGQYYWDYFDISRPDVISYNTNGAECKGYLIGFGYNESVPGAIPVWNFGGSYTAVTYGWDSSVDTRLTAIEESIGDAEAITQNILGY